MQLIEDELDKAFKSVPSKHVKFKRTGHLDAPDHPDPMIEPDDMVIVVSPCHGYEPVKCPTSTPGRFTASSAVPPSRSDLPRVRPTGAELTASRARRA